MPSPAQCSMRIACARRNAFPPPPARFRSPLTHYQTPRRHLSALALNPQRSAHPCPHAWPWSEPAAARARPPVARPHQPCSAAAPARLPSTPRRSGAAVGLRRARGTVSRHGHGCSGQQSTALIRPLEADHLAKVFLAEGRPEARRVRELEPLALLELRCVGETGRCKCAACRTAASRSASPSSQGSCQRQASEPRLRQTLQLSRLHRVSKVLTFLATCTGHRYCSRICSSPRQGLSSVTASAQRDTRPQHTPSQHSPGAKDQRLPPSPALSSPDMTPARMRLLLCGRAGAWRSGATRTPHHHGEGEHVRGEGVLPLGQALGALPQRACAPRRFTRSGSRGASQSSGAVDCGLR
jgi:hypothetical protein